MKVGAVAASPRRLLGSTPTVAGAVVGAVVTAPFVALAQRRRHPGAEVPLDPVSAVHTVPADDGTPLHVRVLSGHAEHGPTFVLTHGLSCDHRLWWHQAGLLADLGRVVLWDLRGHGDSRPADPATLNPARFAADLAHVVDATAVGPVFLVGHSLGGVATLLALRDDAALRERTAGAVVVATPTTDLARTVVGGGASDLGTAALRTVLRWAVGDPLVGRVFLGGSVRGYATVRAGGFGTAPSPAHVHAILDQLRRMDAASRRATLAGMEGLDLRGTLSSVDVPTLVVVGGRDRLVDPAAGEALAQELPNARAIVFRSAGHGVVLERHAAITRRIALLAAQVLTGDGDLEWIAAAGAAPPA